MRSFLRLPLLATGLLGLTSLGHAQSATLETAPLSILWNFTDTGVVSSFIALPPYIEGTPGAVDPDTLRPTDRITTDIGSPITAPTTGDQAFFTEQLLRTILERYAEEYKELAIAQAPEVGEGEEEPEEIPPTPEMAALEAKIAYLKTEVPSASGSRWELTAVREPQNTIEGATETPYAIFISRINRTRAGISPNYDTGLRISPVVTVGNATETFTDNGTLKIGGNYTTHFRLEFSSFYAADPLHLVEAAERKDAEYNTSGDLWIAMASGYMTYNLRTTAGGQAVAPTKIKITGHGSWSHAIISPEGSYSFGGIAPLSIKMGEIKYQNRNMFPDFSAD